MPSAILQTPEPIATAGIQHARLIHQAVAAALQASVYYSQQVRRLFNHPPHRIAIRALHDLIEPGKTQASDQDLLARTGADGRTIPLDLYASARLITLCNSLTP